MGIVVTTVRNNVKTGYKQMGVDSQQIQGIIYGMGLEQDILTLFRQVVAQCDDNKSKAAKLMDVTPVALSYWISGARRISPEACKAVDRLGGKLLIPEELTVSSDAHIATPTELMEQKIDALERENALLRKLVALYEQK